MRLPIPMNRLNQILAVLLVIQLALGVVVFWPSQAATAGGGPLFAGLQAENVVELTIGDGAGSVTLARQGEAWVLPEADDFPATAENIDSLLEALAGIETNRLVTRTETSHERLQVAQDDFNRRVDLRLADGTTHRLFVGSSGGANATHVRAEDQPEVYLAQDVNAWDANPQAAGWIDTLYFEVAQDELTGLTLENENGTFEFVKTGESWTLADLADDETLDETAINTLLGQVSSVRMTNPLGKTAQASYGLDNPTATVTLQTAAESYTLTVGAKNPEADNSYVLKASNSPYYVWVSAFTGNNFVEKTRADFLQSPPTPQAESDAAESQ